MTLTVPIQCNDCKRSFYGQQCYQRHFLPSFGNESACQTLKKCTACFSSYSLAWVKRVHVCGQTLCTMCDKFVAPSHLCYVQPDKPSLPKHTCYLYFFILSVLIQHAGNGRERKICALKVDGYSEDNNENTVWEYQGCFFHGCPICFKNRGTAIKGAPERRWADVTRRP